MGVHTHLEIEEKSALISQYAVTYRPGPELYAVSRRLSRFFANYDEKQSAALPNAVAQLHDLLWSLGMFAGAASTLNEPTFKDFWGGMRSSRPSGAYLIEKLVLGGTIPQDARMFFEGVYSKVLESPWSVSRKMAKIGSNLAQISLEVERELSADATWTTQEEAYARGFSTTALKKYQLAEEENRLRQGGRLEQSDDLTEPSWEQLLKEIDFNGKGIAKEIVRVCGIALLLGGTTSALLCAAPGAALAFAGMAVAGAILAIHPDHPEIAIPVFSGGNGSIKDQIAK